jgi:hypothetical protein
MGVHHVACKFSATVMTADVAVLHVLRAVPALRVRQDQQSRSGHSTPIGHYVRAGDGWREHLTQWHDS